MFSDVYTKSKDLNLYFREPAKIHTYMDLDETRIRHIINTADNVASLSETLHQAVTDWPTETNLSRQRHCLIRPFPIKPNESVLELGSGCGAITRYLGETGANITAVEGSQPRAEITALRCIDLPNVKTVVDDITHLSLDEKFDWIFMVGVLEYARMFVHAPNPEVTLLRAAASHLSVDGKLVIAIENQLGLSFFNGRSEDHTGVPFFGINDLYQDQGVATYGRRVLAETILDAGLQKPTFMYPFPDYKVPRVILTQDAASHENFTVSNLLYGVTSRDYYGRDLELFDESLVYSVLDKNGLIEDLAPSFIAVTGRPQGPTFEPSALAWIYSIDFRQSRFACETTFTADQDVRSSGTIRVSKSILDASESASSDWEEDTYFTHQVSNNEPYINGDLLALVMAREIARTPTLEQSVKTFVPWAQYCLNKSTLREGSHSDELRSWLLPNDAVECIPPNIIVHEGQYYEIDKEWVSQEPIPLSWILYRGIQSMNRSTVTSKPFRLDKIYNLVCEEIGLAVSPNKSELKMAQELERKFRHNFINYTIYRPPYSQISYNSRWFMPRVYEQHESQRKG